MSFKMPRKVKDLLIDYVKQYAKQIIESKDKVRILNAFDPQKAAAAAEKALLANPDVTSYEKELIQTKEGREHLVSFFEEKLVVNYFMFSRNIGYYEAKSLLTDKGTKAFPETEGIDNPLYKGRFKDYKATQNQMNCIESYGSTIKHKEELTGREASQIIKCIKTKTRTKPAYFTYYI